MTTEPVRRQSRDLLRPRPVSVVVFAALVTLILLIAPDVLLVIFAGLLFGVFFSGGGTWIADRLGIGRGWGIGLFILLVVLALSGVVLAFAPLAVDQFEQLSEQVPEAFGQIRDRLQEYSWGEKLLDRVTPGALMDGGGGTAAGAVSTTFGALGNFVIMLFIGLYVALAPQTYCKGLLALLAPSLRNDGAAILRKATDTLGDWLVAQLMAMTIVGVLTWLGLWLIGVPLAPILGLLAALLAFIPNLGPIIAAVPAVLLGLSEGSSTALMVIGVYIAVQTLESYVITPLIQQNRVSLPPALIIGSQLLLGILFGLLGLALATPLAALSLTLVREIYVARFLENEPEPSHLR
ncbi:AI-2E family transporter [Paracoccus sp. NSM]|uniref:AI-2E family transporter n=1 Tax=Paracoccus sp. NSM TaxID=3457784 RepID=UPI0040361AAC